ncbi:MAG: hypothetical protein Q4D38_08075 [Planctomycetia bacterium]|nr:hypothetical protein [Planctomycetia bacterium]
MKSINYRELKRQVELDGAAQTADHLSEALDEHMLAPEDFSLRDLAETLVPDGTEWVRTLNPSATPLIESGAVDSTAFLNITGKIIQSKIKESYEHPAFVASKLVPVVSTRLSRERIPGVGQISADTMHVHEGMPYPNAGFGEEYVDTPETMKHGLIVPVTKEAIFFDQTGLVLRRATEVGEILGADREKRILDVILGIQNTYSLNGTPYNTYYASSDNGPWVNKIDSNELQNWGSVDAAEQIFANMLDSNTGDPILINAESVLIMPAKRFTAARIFFDAQLEWENESTSSGNHRLTFPNPLSKYRVFDSAYAYRRLITSGVAAADAAKYWFIGDFKRAFAYLENWGLSIAVSNAHSEAAFAQDILVRYKASERGTPAVLDPRYVVCCK